jgi:hypothetical protein
MVLSCLLSSLKWKVELMHHKRERDREREREREDADLSPSEVHVYNNILSGPSCGGLYVPSSSFAISNLYFLFNDVMMQKESAGSFYDVSFTDGSLQVLNNIFYSPASPASTVPSSASALYTFANNYYVVSNADTASLPDTSDSVVTNNSAIFP